MFGFDRNGFNIFKDNTMTLVKMLRNALFRTIGIDVNTITIWGKRLRSSLSTVKTAEDL